MIILQQFWQLPYVRWHLIFTIIPSVVIWGVFWKYLIRFKKTIFSVIVFSLIWGLLFDLVASDWLHVWHFNTVQNLHISLLGLPLEEYVFFILVSQELATIFLLLKRKLYHE